MNFETYLFVFLLLHTYLQVTRSGVVHNDPSSGRRNTSFTEVTKTDMIDQDIRLNTTHANEKNFTNHVSKEKNKRHKTRKISKFQKVNSTINGEENADINQVRSLTKSLNTIPTKKMEIDNEQPCEAMVLTYGPIGFTSALELIGNGSSGHIHSMNTNNDPLNSEDNVRKTLNKRIIIKDPTMIFSSQEEFTDGKLNSDIHNNMTEEKSKINDNVPLNQEEQYNKQSAESIISDPTNIFRYNSHMTKNVVNSNKHSLKKNVAVESDTLEKDKIADERSKSVDNENIKDKLVEKRYIPLLHPMSDKEDDKKKNDEYVIDYLSRSGGSNRFDGKTTDELKKELNKYFYTWPKPLEWLYSNPSKNMHEENKSTEQNLPSHTYESSVYPHLEHLGSAETYDRKFQGPYVELEKTCVCTLAHELAPKPQSEYMPYHKEHDNNFVPNNHQTGLKINKENEPTNLNLPIRIYESPVYTYGDLHRKNLGPAETFDKNLQNFYLEPDKTCVYSIEDTRPHELAPEPPFHYTSYHKQRDNIYDPLNPGNNPKTMNIARRRELYYHPIDYQYLLKKHEYESSFIDDGSYNEPILQRNKPEYRYQQAKPLDQIYQTNQ